MTTVTTLASMVDNAITLPENGVINFKLLRAFLHSLIQHLRLDSTVVKYDATLEETESEIVLQERKEREGKQSPKALTFKEKESDDYDKERSVVSIPPEIYESIGRLEKKVKEMESKLEAAESSAGHGEAPRSSAAFADSLKLTSITKRVDACEESLQKLAPAFEDLAKESSTNSRKFNELVGRLSSAVPGLEGINELLMVNEKSTENVKTGVEIKRISLSSMNQSGIDNKVIEAFTEMQQNLIAMKEEMSDLCSQQKYISSITETMPIETIAELQSQVAEIKTQIQNFGGTKKGDSFHSETEKMELLQMQINDQTSKINELYHNLADQMDQSQGHITDLEKELAIILEKINVNSKSEISDMTSLGELYEKIMNMQENVNVLNETATKLTSDHEDKQTDIDILVEQVELIKTLKADKEALEDALTDKADTLTVNRKVSHDQFDAAFEELNHTIEEAQAKLGEQEKGWLNALEEIQKEISSKIDRIEITPLKEMIDNKMQYIQEKIKAMTAKRQEIEALGTKKKLLRNLNCLSCDTKVVMRTTLHGSGLPRMDSLPPNRSMRPYLTYELDQFRQQNRRLPSRNMLHYGNAVAEQRWSNSVPKSDQRENHLCSRYCGGSHTIVTSQQRVTRVGHFPDGVVVSGKGTQGPVGNNKNDECEQIKSPNPTPRSSRNEA